MNKLNRYRKFNSIVQALQNNDVNGSWNEILKEVDNCYNEAIKVLYEALKTSYEEANTYDDIEFYKCYLNHAKEIL